MSEDEFIIEDDGLDVSLLAGVRRCNPIAKAKKKSPVKKAQAKIPKQKLKKKKRVVAKKKGAKRGSTGRTISSRQGGPEAGREARPAAGERTRRRFSNAPATGRGGKKGRGSGDSGQSSGTDPRPANGDAGLPDPGGPAAADRTVVVDAHGAIVYGEAHSDGNGTEAGRFAGLEYPFWGFISGNCILPYDAMSIEDFQQALERLKVTSPKVGDDGSSKSLNLWVEHDQYVEFPRAWSVENIGPERFQDAMSWGKELALQFYGHLDEERGQIRITRDIYNNVRPGIGGVAQAPCGTGKTIMGLYMIAKWNRTAAVLVHKEFLADQWEEEAQRFLGLKPEEIGRVQGPKCVYKGKKLVLVMVESIAAKALGKSKDYPLAMYEHFGTVVLDEVHRHAADTWHLAIGKFPAAYRLGLTATPHRNDGMEQVVFNHVGPIISETTGYKTEPKVYQVLWKKPYNAKSFAEWKRGKMTGNVNMARLINRLAKDGDRNNMLATFVVQAIEAGRKVIVLSERLAQLNALLDLVYLKLEKEATLAKYVGGMSRSERDEAAKANGIFGTYHMAAEGLDIPDLDTLVMATPRSNVEQSVGRILRSFDGKMDPFVVDPVDADVSVCRAMAAKREDLYDGQGWAVEVVEPA